MLGWLFGNKKRNKTTVKSGPRYTRKQRRNGKIYAYDSWNDNWVPFALLAADDIEACDELDWEPEVGTDEAYDYQAEEEIHNEPANEVSPADDWSIDALRAEEAQVDADNLRSSVSDGGISESSSDWGSSDSGDWGGDCGGCGGGD